MSNFADQDPGMLVVGVDSGVTDISDIASYEISGDSEADSDPSKDTGGGDRKSKRSKQTVQEHLVKTLNINVLSIVVGALSFVVIASWVETFRAGASAALDDEENRYDIFYRKVFSSFVTTLFVVFLIILLYVWYKGRWSLA